MYLPENLSIRLCKWFVFVGYSCDRDCDGVHVKFDDCTTEDKRKIEQYIVQSNGTMWFSQSCRTVSRENNHLVGNVNGPSNTGT